MLSDPGFNEGVLEFSLYFDLLQRLRLRVRSAPAESGRRDRPAGRGGRRGDVGEGTGGAAPGDPQAAAAAAGLPADPETLLGRPMEKYPREIPPEYRLRELNNTLATMTLKDLRLSALSTSTC